MSQFQSSVQRSERSGALRDWCSLVQRAQSRRSPEEVEALRERWENQRRATRSARRAKTMERTNFLASASSAVAYLSPPCSSTADHQRQQRLLQTCSMPSRGYGARTNEVDRTSSDELAMGMDMFGQDRSSDDDEAEQNLVALGDEISSAFQTCRNENLASLVTRAREAPDSDAFDQMTSELGELLEQLAVEPSSEAEIAAKFLLYEGFASTVETIRGSVEQFWEENKEQFSGAPRAACEREIQGIDSTTALGVEDSDKWVVYGMTKKVNLNSKMINSILVKLRTRLQLLSEAETECPMCLEVVPKDPAGQHILGCCHRTCKTCWDNWSSLKGPASAFCPLCRHQDFLSDLMSLADEA